MDIQTIAGKKNPQDKMIAIKTREWEVVSFKDLITIIRHMFINEDVLYPRPQFKGRGQLMNCILKVYSEGIDLEQELRTRK